MGVGGDENLQKNSMTLEFLYTKQLKSGPFKKYAFNMILIRLGAVCCHRGGKSMWPFDLEHNIH